VIEAIRDLKVRVFPKGIRRWARSNASHLFKRTTERNFTRAFEWLDLDSGSVVCIHAAVSGFGYLPGGPASIIRALRTAYPKCTIMMPSFPFGNTTVSYLETDPVFDPEQTPSASGLLSEVLRCTQGVKRSCHPTHPCIALGPVADELIEGSEDSETPFGPNSTYGRYSRMGNAVLLLLHTNSTSHVHTLQELVKWPNLFLPGLFPARAYDRTRSIRNYRVAVHRPQLPLYVGLPADKEGENEYLWMPDYVVQFPSERETYIMTGRHSRRTKEMLSARQQMFFKDGVFKKARCGPGEILAIHLIPWQERLCQDMTANLQEYPKFYTEETLLAAKKSGMLKQ
jgi:aminoglycoside N3'-acetyltransferase